LTRAIIQNEKTLVNQNSFLSVIIS